MQSGAETDDMEYFASDSFVYHCMLLGLDADDILQVIVRKRLIVKKEGTNHTYETMLQDEGTIRWLHDIEGYSQVSLGTMYNVSYITIRKLLNGDYAAKIAFNEKRGDIIRDYLDGVPTKELMFMYDVSESSLYRVLKDVKKRSKTKSGLYESMASEKGLYE